MSHTSDVRTKNLYPNGYSFQATGKPRRRTFFAAAFKSLLLFLPAILFFSTVFAQVVLPPSDIDCPSKDLEVTSATLPAPANDPCSCTGTRILQLGIINKTGSDRTSFAMWGKLIRKDASGNPVGSPEAIFACASGIKASSTNFYPTTTSITVACAQSLEIVDVILAWTSANKKETCEVLYNNPSTINPKCGRVDAIRVETGVDASFNITNATCTSNGSFQVFPFGGIAPYTVATGSDSRTVNAGSFTTFNLSAGAHNINITDSRGCTVQKSRTVGAPDAVAKPGVSVTQPTCTVNTGTVNVTAPDNTVVYKLKQGGVIKYTAASGVFSNVIPGAYQFVASKGICSTDGDDVTVNSQPATPDAPSAGITQPTCVTAKGTITITAPLGAGITYSINGTDYQAGTTFNNVNAGTYNVTAKANGCTSASTSKTVNPQPATPDAPSAGVTQPTCATAKGTITITAPLGAGITYSINGEDYQAGITFSNVDAGTYNVTAKANGCISGSTSKTVNQQPTTPDAPAICVVQPSLCGSAGSVTINNPTGGFEYSIDNGATWHASNVFGNLGAGSVSGIKVKSADGCISAAVSCDASDCSSQTGARSQTTSSTENKSQTLINSFKDLKVSQGQTTVKAFPNPFGNKVKFVVAIPEAGNGSFELVNLMGQKIKTVFQGRIPAGINTFEVNLPLMRSSQLMYILRMGDKQVTGKLLQLNR